ncbi:ATP-binding protein [Saccharopolyspora erythraea]|uniref:ATP-binding protein n=1 Tax=Saccharopolyspora erythraea TaxID=1836 RepID=UPI001BAC7D42|nr:ATP-binding protein [Saccharopolyspora erythraea]QUH03982.1 ATP-binding protein [Saccharopolyspora erythraea]
MEPLISAVAPWCLSGGVVALGAMWLRQRRITARLRRRGAVLERGLREREDEAAHLVTTRLPALTDPVYHRPAQVPGLLHPELRGTDYAHELEQVTVMFAESADKALARADKSAQAALKAVMKTVQGLAKEQQLAISTMQDEHDDPTVLEGLLEIDHANSQLSRRAQAIAVLCGSWAGQQRSAATLTDAVRGATSRIRHYLRVRLHAQSDVAVTSWSVEPVVLTLAELLDNAARYSPPTTTVEVNFHPAHNGIAVVVDDAGIGMDTEARERATTVLSGGRRSVDITALGDPPQVGFAVIGVLAARYGFSVSVDTVSPYGGVRAVVFLPNELLTSVAAPEPDPQISEADPQGSSVGDLPAQRSTAGGLPKRRRRQRAPEPSSTAHEPPARSAGPASTGLGAWQRGTLSGRNTTPSDNEGNRQE